RPSSFGTSLPFWECKGNSFILICKSFFNFFSEALSSTTPSKNQDLLQNVKILLLFPLPLMPYWQKGFKGKNINQIFNRHHKRKF
ncbi:MAG TPA: hypothetical protein VIM75_21005, partial [Ohtaekwangia sp.]|uniref:hypothetical protein n=1 Tax=Ohtaekwangia sp. TaxID=2066019 RepID=UPI002F923FA4